MDEKLKKQIIKWYIESNYETRNEIRKYVFGLSFLNSNQKEIIWNEIMYKALKSKSFMWRGRE